jgi:hypothetical protein
MIANLYSMITRHTSHFTSQKSTAELEPTSLTIWPVVIASIIVVEPSASAVNVPRSLEKEHDETPE